MKLYILENLTFKMDVVRSKRKIQYVVKSYGKCQPPSAWALAQNIAASSGTCNTCALCLCSESLLSLSEWVTLKDEHTDLRLTLNQLIQQLNLIPPASLDHHSSYYASLQKICKTCVNKLSSFFLFSKRCLKTATALKNIEEIVLNAKKGRGFKNTKITKTHLPYENIYKYVEKGSFKSTTNEDTAFTEDIETINTNVKSENDLNCEFKICRRKSKTSDAFGSHCKNLQIVDFKGDCIKSESEAEPTFHCGSCSMRNFSWFDYAEHQTAHSCEKLLRNILQNKPFCICCLREGDDLVGVSQPIIFNEMKTDAKISSLNTIFHQVFGASMLSSYEPTYICESCINQTIHSYNFKKIFERSITMISKCNSKFEKSLQQSTVHLNKLLGMSKLNIYVNLLDVQNNVDNVVEVKIGDGAKESNSDFNDHNDLAFSEEEESTSKVPDKALSKPKYQCSECNKKFASEMKLKQHERVKTNCVKKYCKFTCNTFSNNLQSQTTFQNENAFFCDYCNKKCFSKEILRVHIFKKHLKKYRYNCKDCEKNFRSLIQCQSHRCRYKCKECVGHKCIHLKFLKGFQKQRNSNPKTQLKCIDCEFVYHHKYEIIAHSNKEHLSHNPHLCDICGEKFASKGDLKHHRGSKHKQIMNCPYCSKVMKDQSILGKHILKCQSTNKPYKCDICMTKFTSKDKMTFHRRKHFPKNFSCQFCQGQYWTKSELNGHLKRSHKDFTAGINNSNKLYQCTMCFSDFRSKKESIDHVTKSHSADSKHICRICNTSFKSKINYYGHLKRHNVKKDCECPVCGKFYTKYNIEAHVKCHSSKKNYRSRKTICTKNTMCDICGRLLSNQASLMKHREIHKEQEQCPHCLKFINSIIFDRHLRTHENTEDLCGTNQRRSRKIFHCNECDYSSIFADCLEAHENRFHLHVRPFKCDTCNKGFYAKITLKEHIRTHAGIKPEQCEQCGNRFVSKKALRLHVRIHTGEKPYKCDLCEERFLSASRRQAHRLRKHFEPSVQCQLCLKMYYTQSAVRIHIRDYHSGEPRQRTGKKKTV